MKIFVAGHNGMVGASICRALEKEGIHEIYTQNRSELDLTDASKVEKYFKKNYFDKVYVAAAKVGGILANNKFPAEFIHQNIAIQTNLIHTSYITGIKKLIFLGSSCIYPKFADQPIKENNLLNGELESTNEAYAIAKIAGIKMCESYNRQYGVDYRSVMPTNLYGPGDNFHDTNSHVIPALIKRFHEAKVNKSKEVIIWGTGQPMREFLHVDDMASACIFLMNLPKEKYMQHTETRCSHINVGSGKDCTIRELSETVSQVVGYEGLIKFDRTKPDGTPRKLLDVSKLNSLGWNYSINLKEGLRDTYEWYLDNIETCRSI